MTTVQTSPLRPQRVRHPDLSRRLEARQNAICESWVTRVQANPPIVSGHRLDPLETDLLRALYVELHAGLSLGHFAAFDEALSSLAYTGHRNGYRLSDLLNIIIALNDQIEEILAADFPPQQALSYIQALDRVLDYALTHIARAFSQEADKTVAAERERTQARLAELDRAKSRFINIAAHELKTPLTLIQGYSDILLNDLIDPSNERGVFVARGLAAGARRLQQIVNDMIAVSMIDNAMLALHLQPTSVTHVVNIVVNDLKTQMEGRQLALSVEPIPDEIKAIYADPQRLYDALAHVIGNSIKYTPDGGAIRVAARLLHLSQGEESVLEITIADDGIGIALEDQGRIFEKFYGPSDVLLHSSGRTKFKGGGPGLGLAVAKGIVEAHGGKIWVESPGLDEVNRPGTIVFILLPARVSMPDASQKLHLELSEAGG
jgi:signal transduction histidine kinase